MEKRKLLIVPGVQAHRSGEGNYYLIDSQNGKLLNKHYCSSKEWALNDLFKSIPKYAEGHVVEEYHNCDLMIGEIYFLMYFANRDEQCIENEIAEWLELPPRDLSAFGNSIVPVENSQNQKPNNGLKAENGSVNESDVIMRLLHDVSKNKYDFGEWFNKKQPTQVNTIPSDMFCEEYMVLELAKQLITQGHSTDSVIKVSARMAREIMQGLRQAATINPNQ